MHAHSVCFEYLELQYCELELIRGEFTRQTRLVVSVNSVDLTIASLAEISSYNTIPKA